MNPFFLYHFPHPSSVEQSDEEHHATEGQFDSHRCPHTWQTIGHCQQGGERQSHAPHGAKAHDSGFQRVASTDEHTVTDDGRSKQWFREGLNA